MNQYECTISECPFLSNFCRECPYEKSNIENEKAYYKKYGVLLCDKCGKSFKTKKELDEHYDKEHNVCYYEY